MLEDIPLLFLKRSVAGFGRGLFLFLLMSIDSTPPPLFAKSSLLADSLFIDDDAPGAADEADEDCVYREDDCLAADWYLDPLVFPDGELFGLLPSCFAASSAAAC